MVKLLLTGLVAAVAIFLGLVTASAVDTENTLHHGPAKDDTAGVTIKQDKMAALEAELAKSIESTPAKVMKKNGLTGAVGGARVRIFAEAPQHVILPLPQLTGGQVPICYFIRSTPPEAVTEFRLRKRDDDNVVVAVRLAGKKQDVQIAWAAVVLLTDRDITPNRTPTAPYLKESACVQARADAIGKLATQLWPKSEKASAFAANIQGHIRDSKRTAPPKSLDALGILKSGENSICTANANLAAALLRSKGIACRSVAVIPTTGQRLEMHRIVEFAEGERWLPFDPSLIHADIPTKPWQYVVMSRTTVADEQVAMKPRLGVMFGCPYGQELELLTPGVGLFGQDFFWTAARPLADFDVPEATARRAAKAWTHFLETGTLTPGQLKARSARTAKALAEALESK